jgi:hypothetical protein
VRARLALPGWCYKKKRMGHKMPHPLFPITTTRRRCVPAARALPTGHERGDLTSGLPLFITVFRPYHFQTVASPKISANSQLYHLLLSYSI